ncbi:MAG: aromatic ring-hydroxylating dioxygenase subunit alpha [Candidatus Binatia bacterium]
MASAERQNDTLPPEWYSDCTHWELERERVLARSWMCIGHASELPSPGDFFCVEVAGEPLLATRGEDGRLRVLSAVCRHRGALIATGCGSTRRFVCPYHAWTYGLDGRLVGAPEMSGTHGFNMRAYPLPEIPSAVWEGFLLVNLSGGAEPLSQRLAALADRLSRYRLGAMRVARRLEFACDWNWKVMVENYMECYHHLRVHRETLEQIIPARSTWSEPGDGAWAMCHMPISRDVVAYKASTSHEPRLPEIAGLREDERRRGTLVHVFPNLVMVLYPDRMDFLRVLPAAADATRVDAYFCVPEAACASPDFAPAIDAIVSHFQEFTDEDFAICRSVQRGLSARYAAPGPYNRLEGALSDFARWMRARIAG